MAEDDDDFEITEASFSVEVAPNTVTISFDYSDEYSVFTFKVPTQRIANVMGQVLERSDFLEVAWNVGGYDAVKVLNAYLHPLRVWMALSRVSPTDFDYELAEKVPASVDPIDRLGSTETANFRRGHPGVTVEWESGYGTFVTVGQPFVWMNFQLLMSAFDWKKHSESSVDITGALKAYFYPVQVYDFLQRT